MKKHRIKFYSKADMSVGHQLSKAKVLFESYNQENKLSLNDLFEFYNIKLYFDNDLFLLNWSADDKTKYIEIVDQTFKILKKQILAINDNSLLTDLQSLDNNYYDNYWSLIVNLNVYKNISETTIEEILNKKQRQIYHILTLKKLLEKFDKVIRNFLLSYKSSAEILLSSLEEKDTFNNKSKHHFPKSLSIIDKEEIINRYLDSDDPNLNYVRLIEKSIDSNEFRLNAKTRLKAKKRSTELNDKLLEKSNAQKFGVGVSFSKDQIEPVKYNSDRTNYEVSYSESYIDRFTDNIKLFKMFKHLFAYIDDNNLITLVSKYSELDVLERTLMKSKNEYETGVAFKRKEYLSYIQLLIFDNYLKKKNKSIEALINSYIDFINKKISPHKLIFKISLGKSKYLEKFRTVAPDFEFFLKQFKTFVDEKCIDLELIQINSTPIRFSEIPSFKKRKYLYSNDDSIIKLKYLFFSDQSPIHYIKHFENKYRNLYDLLRNEDVKLEHFANYQQDIIENLINDDYLKIDGNNHVVLNKDILIFLIGEIHMNEVISYWSYPKSFREEMDVFIDGGLFIDENTLFTLQEKNYLNFYLNKKEFTNGYDLRNKYLHGTNSFSEDEHKFDYYRLLKIIVLTLLKIEDDLTEQEE